jgi:hypothetical protein
MSVSDFDVCTDKQIVVPELSSVICHVKRMQIAQDSSGTMKCPYFLIFIIFVSIL